MLFHTGLCLPTWKRTGLLQYHQSEPEGSVMGIRKVNSDSLNLAYQLKQFAVKKLGLTEVNYNEPRCSPGLHQSSDVKLQSD